VSARALRPATPQRRTPPPLSIELSRRVRGWLPARRELVHWASAAAGRQARGRELGVSVVGPLESARLNARFRGRETPTNVLSFSAAAPAHGAGGPGRALGELVICPRVLADEARAQAKTLRAHWAHLVVHGTLHLIGYDHQVRRDARRMERREIAVLRRLGFANPYRERSA
jgi:probable rRNA maturation factor